METICSVRLCFPIRSPTQIMEYCCVHRSTLLPYPFFVECSVKAVYGMHSLPCGGGQLACDAV